MCQISKISGISFIARTFRCILFFLFDPSHTIFLRIKYLFANAQNNHSFQGLIIMKGNDKIIEGLNQALTIELTAINQYFIQAKMCKNWGISKLAAKHYEESMGEMKHAEKLIDRILFLEGVPEIARYDVIRVGSDIPEQFTNDLALETKGVLAYNNLIAPVSYTHLTLPTN